MKSFLLIVSIFSFSIVKAQIGSALFKKGTELEYKTYSMRTAVGSMKIVETTTITLIVTDVKDSNNVTYSFITKKAHAASDPEIGYQKNLVISRSNNVVTLPQDLYYADTVYMVDMGVKGKKGRKPYATSQCDNANVKVSGSIENGKFEFAPKNYTFSGMRTAMNSDRNSAFFNSPMESGWKIEVTVKSVSVGPKTSVTTPAGKFDCYKITSHFQMKIYKAMTTEVVSSVYYSDEYGFIKMDSEENGGTGGYELVRVKTN